jgi:hypothetical protein
MQLRGARLTGLVFAAAMLAFAGSGRQHTVTASPFTAFHEPAVEAFLYNPPLDEVTWKYPYNQPAKGGELPIMGAE